MGNHPSFAAVTAAVWWSIAASTLVLTAAFTWLLWVRRRTESLTVRVFTTLAYIHLFILVPFLTLDLAHDHFLRLSSPIYVDFNPLHLWFSPCAATAAAVLLRRVWPRGSIAAMPSGSLRSQDGEK
jgi:hypothetical protein